ncbi:MAG: hypothetical protein M0R66_01175 [Candidatus Omnitrophica bacterium]|nr:hypothetical protein [Candidatus Omnitrophota bacterium]
MFNQQVSKQEFEEIKAKIWKGLPYHLHPKNLSTENVAWLKKNVKQFNQKVLDEIVAQSVLPNKSVVIQEKED